MKLSYWMAAKAIIEAVFGVGFVLMPRIAASYFGMDLTPAGVLMGQLFGTAFIFGSIVAWLARNARSDVVQPILIGIVVSNAIGFVVTLMATLSGVWNVLGWLPVALYLVFGLAFAYFLFVKPVAQSAPSKA